MRGSHVEHRVTSVHLDTGRDGDRGQSDGDRVPVQVQAHQPGNIISVTGYRPTVWVKVY